MGNIIIKVTLYRVCSCLKLGEMADVGELRTLANENWSLDADIKLQGYLAAFSTRIGQKTKTLVDNVEHLSNDVGEADVRLRNTFNEFLMLGNTQFIENVRRVPPSPLLLFTSSPLLLFTSSSLIRILFALALTLILQLYLMFLLLLFVAFLSP